MSRIADPGRFEFSSELMAMFAESSREHERSRVKDPASRTAPVAAGRPNFLEFVSEPLFQKKEVFHPKVISF